MPKPNYQYEKRQKDLAKKQKQEEKRLKKAADKAATSETGDHVDETPATPDGNDAGPLPAGDDNAES